jgi:hypothetical protein
MLLLPTNDFGGFIEALTVIGRFIRLLTALFQHSDPPLGERALTFKPKLFIRLYIDLAIAA